MREFKGYGIIVGATILIQLFSIGFCVRSGSLEVQTVTKAHTDMSGISFVTGCACPVNRCTIRKNDMLRNSLTAYLSTLIARSIEERNVALTLQCGGTETMSKNPGRAHQQHSYHNIVSPQELEEQIRRAEKRIELAKRVIAEQELSSRLEHQKLRRKTARSSGS